MIDAFLVIWSLMRDHLLVSTALVVAFIAGLAAYVRHATVAHRRDPVVLEHP